MSMVDLKCEYQNQFLLFLNILFSQLFFTSIAYSLWTVHYILLPFEVPYQVCSHAVRQLITITKIVCVDVFNLLNWFKLNLELLLQVSCGPICLLLRARDSEVHRQKILGIYSKMKEILLHFHIIPLTPREAIVNSLILQKVPSLVWKYLLPYPQFIFEDTLSKVVVNGDEIIVTLPPIVPVMVMKDKVREHCMLHLSAKEYLLALKEAEENVKDTND